MPRKEVPTNTAIAQQEVASEGIENFELPKALVTKIAKSAIPNNAKLQKETVLSLVKGSTVFINYLAATAHDVATSKQHKSISASDVLKALEMIQFGDLVDNLNTELTAYRGLAKTDKSKKSGSGPSISTTTTTTTPAPVSAAGPSSASTAAKSKSSAAPPPGAPLSLSIKMKGKEKAQPALSTPFVTTPLAPRPGLSAAAVVAGEPMDVDEVYSGDDEDDVGGGVGADDEQEEEEEDEEEEEEEEEEGDEEMVDTVAVEEEELLKDARGLEGAGVALHVDD